MNDETNNDVDGVEVSLEVVEEQQGAKSKSRKKGNGMKGSKFAG